MDSRQAGSPLAAVCVPLPICTKASVLMEMKRGKYATCFKQSPKGGMIPDWPKRGRAPRSERAAFPVLLVQDFHY